MAKEFPTELTPEVSERLSAPVPKDQILRLNRGAKGGSNIRYTTVNFVEDRLDEVVGSAGWESMYVVTGKTIVCQLRVLGVNKSAVADLNDNSSYGGPGERGQAKVFKRAAKLFGIARELWADEDKSTDDDDEDDEVSERRAKKSSGGSSGGGARSLTENQAKVLLDKGFTKAEVKEAAAIDDVVGVVIEAAKSIGLKRGDKFTQTQKDAILAGKAVKKGKPSNDEDDDDDDEDYD